MSVLRVILTTLGLFFGVGAKRVKRQVASSSQDLKLDVIDPDGTLPDCKTIPSFVGKCLTSHSPGACYTLEGETDTNWQCWNKEQASETMSDEACKSVAGMAGACIFTDHYEEVSDDDLKPCQDVPGFVDQCHPISDKWGACYKKDVALWHCIEKGNDMISGYRNGNCKVTSPDDQRTTAYDDVCVFSNSEQVLYKCDTVPTYDAESAAASCSQNKVPFACFSLRQGVTWQCHDEGTNPSCISTRLPAGEEVENDQVYDGACVREDSPDYESAGSAAELVLREAAVQVTTATTTSSATTTTTISTTTSTDATATTTEKTSNTQKSNPTTQAPASTVTTTKSAAAPCQLNAMAFVLFFVLSVAS